MQNHSRNSSLSLADLAGALLPALAGIAAAFLLTRSSALAPYAFAAGPALVLVGVMFAPRYGLRLGFLAALIASLYFLAVQGSVPDLSEAVWLRLALSALAWASAAAGARLISVAASAQMQLPQLPAALEEPQGLIEIADLDEEMIEPSDPFLPEEAIPMEPKFDFGILQGVPTGIIVFDVENRINLFMTAEARDILGTFSDQSDLEEFDLFDAEGNSIGADELPLIRAAAERGRIDFADFSIRHGVENLLFRMAASPIFSETGEVVAVIAVIEPSVPSGSPKDTRADDFLELARSEMSPQFARVERYISAISIHAGKAADSRAQALAAKLAAQFRRIDRTLQRLLQFARIDFESMPLKVEAFDISRVLGELVAAFQLDTPEHPIIFLPETDANAQGDRFRARKVADHLLRNAIKYSEPGEKIVVGLIAADTPGMLQVSVRDFGVGLDDETILAMQGAFKGSGRFVRGAGLGIGLYTSSEIIRRQGGEMGVRGKKGKGSEFFFTLPIASKAPEPDLINEAHVTESLFSDQVQ